MTIKPFFTVTLLFLLHGSVNALTFTLKDDSDIVGKIQTVTVEKGEKLFDIARRYDLGTYEIIEANPKVNHKKLVAGQELLLPTAFILPPIRQGLVLNLAEMRIYYFHPNDKLVSTFPVGIGKVGWKTPIGETSIVRKREHPTWTPPESIRRASLRRGVVLPQVYPAGPNNPLGDYAINLKWSGYLIHGTNKPDSVGLRSSHGCIRLLPEDIKVLYSLVDVGTLVTVIHMPYKIGTDAGKVYFEAHDPLPEAYYGYDNLTEAELIDKVLDMATKQHIHNLEAKQVEGDIKLTLGYPILLR